MAIDLVSLESDHVPRPLKGFHDRAPRVASAI